MAATQDSTEWWRRTKRVKHTADVPGAQRLPGATDTSSPVAFWALMAFTCVLLLAPRTFIPQLGVLHLAFLTAALSGMMYVLDRFRKRKKVIEFTPEMKAITCLVVWAMFTIPFSIWPGGSVSELFSIFFKSVVIFWLLSRLVDSKHRLKSFVWLLSLISIPLALTAISHYIFGVSPESEGLDRISGYEAPLTGNPNDLALMLNLLLPLTIGLFLGARRPAIKGLLLAIIGLSVMAIVATYSRGGFITLSVIVVAYTCLLIRRHQHKLVLLIFVAALASVPFLPSSYVGRLMTIVNIEADPNGSAQERLRTSFAALEYIAKHPLVGAGIGMNNLAMNQVQGPTWIKVHNVYLVISVELGIAGLIMFLVLMRISFKNAAAAKHLSEEDPESVEFKYIAEGIWVSLLAFAVGALFTPAAYQFNFYYIAGLAAAVRFIAEMHNGKNDDRDDGKYDGKYDGKESAIPSTVRERKHAMQERTSARY